MLNKIEIIGRVGKKKCNTTKSGNLIANLSIATEKKIKNSLGEKESKTTWHHVCFFSKLAEIVESYVNVGELLYVEGEMDYGKYVDKEGVERNNATILAKEIKMFPKSANNKSNDNNGSINDNSFIDDQIPF